MEERERAGARPSVAADGGGAARRRHGWADGLRCGRLERLSVDVFQISFIFSSGTRSGISLQPFLRMLGSLIRRPSRTRIFLQAFMTLYIIVPFALFDLRCLF